MGIIVNISGKERKMKKTKIGLLMIMLMTCLCTSCTSCQSNKANEGSEVNAPSETEPEVTNDSSNDSNIEEPEGMDVQDEYEIQTDNGEKGVLE